MNNYRMWAYSMIAVGLINWDYQRAHPHALVNSLVIIVPGLLLLATTFTEKGRAALAKQSVRYLWIIVGIAALIFAFVNK